MKNLKYIIILLLLHQVVQAQEFANVSYQSQVSGSGRILNKTLPVGSIAGAFDVSGSGAATYSIPVFCSPGTAGMQPNMAVVYSSMAGNGLLGYGANLTGISAIMRTKPNFYNDGFTQPVKADETDCYMLDGQRLLWNQATGQYGTEMESFTTVTKSTISNSTLTTFVVTTKGRTVMEYGTDVKARVETADKSATLIWYINKITDAAGNYMTFVYNTYAATGEVYLESIHYTGNINNGLQPYNRLEFEYAIRSDVQTMYIAGTPLKQTLLLTNIKTYNENLLVKQYTFKYFIDSYSHLNEIAESAADGTALNSTILNWYAGHVVEANQQTLPYSLETGTYFEWGDFNGDGFEDFVSVSSSKFIALNLADKSNPSLFTAAGTFRTVNIHKLVKADFDGDGKDDIITFSLSGTDDMSGNFIKSTGSALINTGTTCIVPKGDVYTGDFDGNGKSECLILSSDRGTWININAETVKLTTSLTGPTYCHDMNGDGKTEIINNGAIYYYVAPDRLVQLPHTGTFDVSSDDKFIDLNGDGFTDILSNNYDPSGLQIKFYTGKTFIIETIPISQPYMNGNICYSPDFDSKKI